MLDLNHWDYEPDVPIEKISLDVDNPRLDDHAKNSDILAISYLVQFEEVIELAKQIHAVGGLFPNEMIICLKQGEDYVVLEGNRRVAACKILLRPSLVSKDHLARQIPRVDDNLRKNIEKLEVKSVSAKFISNPIIAKLHLSKYNRKHWNLRRRINAAYNFIDENIPVDEVSKYFEETNDDIYKYVKYYECLNHTLMTPILSDKEKDIIRDASTDIEPYLDVVFSPKIKEHFGHKLFIEKGEINLKFPEYDNVITQIARHCIVSQRVRTEHRFPKGAAIGRYLKTCFPIQGKSEPLDSNDELDFSFTDDTVKTVKPPIKASDTLSVDHSSDTSATDEGRSPKYIRPVLLETLDYKETKDPRLKHLAAEARVLSQERTIPTLSLSFLIRALLEQGLKLTYPGFSESGKKKKIGLGDWINIAGQYPDRLPKKTLEALQNAQSRTFLRDLENNIHNSSGNSSPENLKIISGALRNTIQFFLDTH